MLYEVLDIGLQTIGNENTETEKLFVRVKYTDNKKSTISILELDKNLSDEEVNQAIVEEGLKVKEIFAGEPERNINMSGQI